MAILRPGDVVGRFCCCTWVAATFFSLYKLPVMNVDGMMVISGTAVMLLGNLGRLVYEMIFGTVKRRGRLCNRTHKTGLSTGRWGKATPRQRSGGITRSSSSLCIHQGRSAAAEVPVAAAGIAAPQLLPYVMQCTHMGPIVVHRSGLAWQSRSRVVYMTTLPVGPWVSN